MSAERPKILSAAEEFVAVSLQALTFVPEPRKVASGI
jgi:hypothetical protein